MREPEPRAAGWWNTVSADVRLVAHALFFAKFGDSPIKPGAMVSRENTHLRHLPSGDAQVIDPDRLVPAWALFVDAAEKAIRAMREHIREPLRRPE